MSKHYNENEERNPMDVYNVNDSHFDAMWGLVGAIVFILFLVLLIANLACSGELWILLIAVPFSLIIGCCGGKKE